MKYGILFGSVSVLLVSAAFAHGGWYLLGLWPATSFGLVAAGYLFIGPKIYGKSKGTLSPLNTILLLPYLL